METTLMQIDTDRRSMECSLTPQEQDQRSREVHSEIAQRRKDEAERDRLLEEASAKKEEGKAVDARIRQRQLKIDALSEAARTGKETRPVEIAVLYDESKGEIVERREDTGELIPLGRKPTAEEWDRIKAKAQPDLPGVEKEPPPQPETGPLADVPSPPRQETEARDKAIADARAIGRNHRAKGMPEGWELSRDLPAALGLDHAAPALKAELERAYGEGLAEEPSKEGPPPAEGEEDTPNEDEGQQPPRKKKMGGAERRRLKKAGLI